jgi:hypothetical protein
MNVPEVFVRLEFDPEFGPPLPAEQPLPGETCEAIERDLRALLETLGIWGTPRLVARALETPGLPGARWMRLTVNGRVCPYSNELLQQIYDYVNHRPAAPVLEPGELMMSFGSGFSPNGGEGKLPFAFQEFLRLACVEIIKCFPSVLLGPAQVAALRDSLPVPAGGNGSSPDPWPPEPEWLGDVLARVLERGISLAERDVIVEVLRAQVPGTSPPVADVAEALVAALRPDVIEIQMPVAYLEELTTLSAESDRNVLALARDGLFYELGMRYPAFRFVPVEDLEPGSFRFKINHLLTAPWVGLEPSRCFTNANATDTFLSAYGIDAEAAINPANGYIGSIIDASEQSAVESLGYTTWNPLQYLVLALSSALRAGGAALVDLTVVEALLAQLRDVYPAVVEGALAVFSLEQITRVLRLLIAEGVSILNLSLILQSMLEFDYVVAGPDYFVLDDRLPASTPPGPSWLASPVTLAAFVRTCLKRQVGAKYAREEGMLPSYVLHEGVRQSLQHYQTLEPTGEAAFRAPVADSERAALRDRVLDAVWNGLETRPAAEKGPVLLVAVEQRAALHGIISGEIPWLPVLAFHELAPFVRAEPITVIYDLDME